MYMAGKLIIPLLLTLPFLSNGQTVIPPIDSTGYRHYLSAPFYGARDFDYSFNTFKCLTPVGQLNGKDSAMELQLSRKIEKIGDRLTMCSLYNTADCNTYTFLFLGAIQVDHYPVLVYVTDEPTPRKVKQQTIFINPMFGTASIDSVTFYY